MAGCLPANAPAHHPPEHGRTGRCRFPLARLEPQDALEFCDRHGVVVRRNTTLDGETIGYQFSESDPEIRQQQGGSEIKLALMKNWRDQCVAQVRGERNHASIQIWSLENEFAFINLINLLGNSPNMDSYEEEITRTHDAVMAADPTRSAMTDGGGALLKNTLVCRATITSPLSTRDIRPGLRAVCGRRRTWALEVGPTAAAVYRRGLLRHGINRRITQCGAAR